MHHWDCPNPCTHLRNQRKAVIGIYAHAIRNILASWGRTAYTISSHLTYLLFAICSRQINSNAVLQQSWAKIGQGSRLIARLGVGIRLPLVVAAIAAAILLIHIRNRITGCPKLFLRISDTHWGLNLLQKITCLKESQSGQQYAE